MKFLISIILTACIFGLTFSEPEPKIEANDSKSEWLTESDLVPKIEKEERVVLADVLEVGMSKYFFSINTYIYYGFSSNSTLLSCSNIYCWFI